MPGQDGFSVCVYISLPYVYTFYRMLYKIAYVYLNPIAGVEGGWQLVLVVEGGWQLVLVVV